MLLYIQAVCLEQVDGMQVIMVTAQVIPWRLVEQARMVTALSYDRTLGQYKGNIISGYDIRIQCQGNQRIDISDSAQPLSL